MPPIRQRLLLAVLIFGTGVSPVLADAAPSARDKALLKKVSQRLLAVCTPPNDVPWPPDVDFDLTEARISAYTTLVTKDDKLQSIVRVTPSLMAKIVQGDPDRLALILGHEMSHLLHRHVVADPKRDRTPFLKVTFTRAQEYEADRGGVELMVKAGFSFHNGKRAFLRFKDLKLEYTSFEALGLDHPSWDDRLANIDKGQEKLWKAMSAFSNGAIFLATEQYESAETCFDRVTQDFPSCYEAWVNLGFACLMRYCDKLDSADLRDYAIGQILTGGFYQRAVSIPVRGKDVKLWWKAVGALREAIRIKPDLTLAKANLGLAYLIHPDGKDVGEAAKLMQEAAEAAVSDTTLDPVAHAALLVNLGVANLAGGDVDKGLAHLDEGEKIGRQLNGGNGVRRGGTALTAALLYNRAQLLGARKDRDSKSQAVALLEKYLKNTSSLSLWWPLAYERYVVLCKALDQEPKDKDAFKKGHPEPIRLVTGVKLKSGAEITLGDYLEDVVKKVGKGEETVAASATNLKRLHYEKEGVDLLVTDVVLAICLAGPQAPELSLRGRTPGSEESGKLRPGMEFKEVETLLGDDYQPCELAVANRFYRFFREQGVALLVSKGKVLEVVVVQIPKN